MKSREDARPAHFIEPIAHIFEGVRTRAVGENTAVDDHVYFAGVEVIRH
jgi:hypothetical protein